MSSLLFELLQHPEFVEGTHWRTVHCDAGKPVFAEGDAGRELYLILQGTLRVLGKVELDEQRQIQPGVGELGEGDVFGELVLFEELPRSASIMAVSDARLAAIDGDALLHFLDKHPEIGYPILKELMTVLVGRLRKANQRIFSLFAWGLKSRGYDSLL